MEGQQSRNAPTVFNNVPLAPPDPIFGLDIAFGQDTDPNKINLGNGVYKDGKGQPFVFPVVRKVEKQVVEALYDKEYLPIDGLQSFIKASQRLTFGQNCKPLNQNRIASIQSISGTGSLRVGFEFLAKYNPNRVYVSNPTWVNHKNILEKSRLEALEYPYYNNQSRSLEIGKMVEFLGTVPEKSIILLHACAHNPTGFDPTQDDWKKIAGVMKKRSLFPYFDSAYQGFASGDLQNDAWAIRYFAELGFEMFVSVSFSKNMGLYSERVGTLHMIVSDPNLKEKILSQIKDLARANYSCPPSHGARIAEAILNNEETKKTWIAELNEVAGRIIEMRKRLREELESINAPGTWNHITDQIGMFSYTGLTAPQVEIMISKYHIYLLKTGRISVSGVNENNVKYLAQSIKATLEETQS